MDPLQSIREQRLLPSDLLRMAQQNNPDLTITLDYPKQDRTVAMSIASALVLRVETARGAAEYAKRVGETWLDVFRRAGLLQR